MLAQYIPDDEWINFEHIRTFQLEKEPFIVMITWTNGEKSIYRGKKAAYLLATWIEIIERDTPNRLMN